MISIPPPSSLPQTPSHHPHVQFQRLQSPLSQSSQSSPTSQTSGKSHVLSLPLSRTSQIPTSPISTSSSHTAPLASPSHSSAIPTIKQEVTDPVESDYGHDTYEDTKPDVSDSHHLEQDLAVAGPSGFQGSADNWDGDADLVSYGGGEVYAESGLEESGDSEAQGVSVIFCFVYITGC
ncbi:hypothetical protein SK128_012417 [Halocaridina rubra]|uniref:Uncharacterized protein n=1 Tax=Halocaridina rubra TaxID=373956 RepID=A0AAN9A8Z0_HALRR